MLNFIFTKKGFDLDVSAGAESEAFEHDKYAALYNAAFAEKRGDLSAAGEYIRLVAEEFLKSLTALPELELAREYAKPRLSEISAEKLLDAVPFALGSEYIDEKWLENIFDSLTEVFAREIKAYDGTVSMYMSEKTQRLHIPERIFFHLVEQKNDKYPFAFLATYATKTENGGIRHMPLQYALTEYRNDREKLLALLSCLNKAAEVSELISDFIKSGEMFHPLRLISAEAYAFLKDAEKIESAGILCRIPNWWKKKSMIPSLSVKLGEKADSMLGFDTIVSMTPQLAIDGAELTREDINELLAQTEGLAFLKGKWVEIDHEKLRTLLERMDEIPEALTLKDAMRLELGEKKLTADVGAVITNGEWLAELFAKLRNPKNIKHTAVPKSLCAVLRPYQKNGYAWLNYMAELGFGACLADDMGLGKTVQVLAYLERMRKTQKDARILLVVPASLLGIGGKKRKNSRRK